MLRAVSCSRFLSYAGYGHARSIIRLIIGLSLHHALLTSESSLFLSLRLFNGPIFQLRLFSVSDFRYLCRGLNILLPIYVLNLPWGFAPSQHQSCAVVALQQALFLSLWSFVRDLSCWISCLFCLTRSSLENFLFQQVYDQELNIRYFFVQVIDLRDRFQELAQQFFLSFIVEDRKIFLAFKSFPHEHYVFLTLLLCPYLSHFIQFIQIQNY